MSHPESPCPISKMPTVLFPESSSNGGNGAHRTEARRRPRWLYWALAALGIVFILGFGAWKGFQRLMKPPPQVQQTEVVQRGTVEIKVVETGQIDPLHKVDVKSKVSGRVARLYVDEGEVVRQGQVMASIDPQEINSEVLALRAQLAGAQARLASTREGAIYQKIQTTTSIDQARHNVDAARSKLQEMEAQSAAEPELKNQAVAVAAANLEAVKASLKGTQDSLRLLTDSTHPQAVVSAKAASEQAAAQADNDKQIAQRQRQLLAAGYTSRQDVETAETQAKVSAAHAVEMKDRVDRIQQSNDMEESNSRTLVAAAEQQVHQMQAQLVQARMSVLPLTMQREGEGARAALEQAQAQLASAQSGRTQDQVRRDDSLAAESDVAQVQNQLNEKLVSQRDTTLYAPMSGIVTRRYVEAGELITSAVSSFAASSPVFQVSDLSTVLVKIDINEVDVAKIRRGMLAEVTVDGLSGKTLVGRVSKIAPAATTSAADAASGTTTQGRILFRVEIQIEHANPGLRPGMSARCAIIVDRRTNVLRLPPNCVTGDGVDGVVHVVIQPADAKGKGSAAKSAGQPITTPRKVKIGLRGDDYVEILSGLKAGEKVTSLPYSGPARRTVDMGPN